MVPRLPACRCQTYVTGSRVFPLVEWEKCLMCVSDRLKCRLIRWTGQYDNISFIIKTPFPFKTLETGVYIGLSRRRFLIFELFKSGS